MVERDLLHAPWTESRVGRLVYFENDARIHLAHGRKATVVRVMGVLAKSLDFGIHDYVNWSITESFSLDSSHGYLPKCSLECRPLT